MCQMSRLRIAVRIEKILRTALQEAHEQQFVGYQ
jgi:hypothetical protein